MYWRGSAQGSLVQRELSAKLTEGLTPSDVLCSMSKLPYNPSVTAYAVPPPFTQGRLWCCTKSQIAQDTERCIEVRSLSVRQIGIMTIGFHKQPQFFCKCSKNTVIASQCVHWRGNPSPLYRSILRKHLETCSVWDADCQKVNCPVGAREATLGCVASRLAMTVPGRTPSKIVHAS